jgi:uncharacterized protein (TIGR02231 family)
MKKLNLTLLLIIQVILATAQHSKTAESKITNVTVFLNKAQVTREVKAKIDAGKTNLVISGLTSMLDPQSIQVSGKGSFIIMGIAHQQNYMNEFNIPKNLKLIRDSLETLQQLVAFENGSKETLNKEELMLVSNQKIGGANQNLTAAELKAMADFYRSRLTEIFQARIKTDEKIKKLNERVKKLQQQGNELNELYTRNTSEIVISLSADSPATVDMDVQYIVANAGWNAVYDLRAINTKSPVQLNYKANVFQSTGEEWNDVKLRLSTANPSLGGLKPELYPWYLNFYYPQQVEKKSKYKAAGAVSRAAAEQDKDEEYAATPAETTASFVNTVQTSLNTEFDIGLPYTIQSSSKPVVVDIRNHELKADYIYSVAPKLDKDAFLIARALGWEDFSLLPGEANVFFEGTFVGKTQIDPNSIKDTLSISLGRDKRIVVKREKLKDFSSKKAIGTNQRNSYAFEISVRNTKTEVVNLAIEDQIPVSQNSQIEVTVGDYGNAKYNSTTGKLAWELVLQPGETKKVTYRFEVKYPRDRSVPGLE